MPKPEDGIVTPRAEIEARLAIFRERVVRSSLIYGMAWLQKGGGSFQKYTDGSYERRASTNSQASRVSVLTQHLP